MKRYIDRFSAILLDVHGTFMFGHDRFGDGEDFHATYCRRGGALLDAAQVERAIRAGLGTLVAVYGDETRHDDCISVQAALHRDPAAALYPRSERALLEEVLAFHERGHVPAEYADCLRTLAKTHRLGLVSNLFARRDGWLRVLDEASVLGLFEVTVFSSDGRSVKPSPRIFRKALSGMGLGPDAVVHVGDSLERDVAGARAAGLASVWIGHGGDAHGHATAPDAVIESLRDLRCVAAPGRSGDVSPEPGGRWGLGPDPERKRG